MRAGRKSPIRERGPGETKLSSILETHVVCRLCHRSYQAVTYTHLRAKHGILDPQAYKDEFSLSKITAAEVRGRIAEQKTTIRKSDLEYLKTHWGRVPLKEIVRQVDHDPATVRAQARRLGLPLLVETWNPEKVKGMIRAARRAGRPLHSGGVRNDNPGLYKAGKYYFGSWEAAVNAAGIKYASIARRTEFESWSKKRIVREIRILQRSGVVLEYSLLERRYSKLYAAARNYFGNWNAALRAARRSS